MRGVEADPLDADVLHVGEDGDDGADASGWFGGPDLGDEIFKEEVVEVVAGEEDGGCGLWGVSRHGGFLHAGIVRREDAGRLLSGW